MKVNRIVSYMRPIHLCLHQKRIKFSAVQTLCLEPLSKQILMDKQDFMKKNQLLLLNLNTDKRPIIILRIFFLMLIDHSLSPVTNIVYRTKKNFRSSVLSTFVPWTKKLYIRLSAHQLNDKNDINYMT